MRTLHSMRLNRLYSWILPREGANCVARTILWNTLAGGVFAASSFILQMLASRWVDLGSTKYWTGLLSIALAMSQQMAPLAIFGMSTFQVSDQNERFRFADYRMSRVFTTLGMLFFGALWCVSERFSFAKSALFGLFLLLRASEAFSSVYGARYQQCGRLDATSRIAFLKNTAALLAYILLLRCTRNIFLAVGGMTVSHLALFILLDGTIARTFSNTRSHPFSLRNSVRILQECLPLAVNAFLIMYINNGTKFAIDAVLDETSMAHYSAIFMTTFGLAMIADFLMSPHVATLSKAYLQHDTHTVYRILGRLTLVITLLALLTLLGSWVWGVQVLSWLFHMDLFAYRDTLCLAILGGALLPFYHLALTVLVIQKCSQWSLPGVLLSALFVALCSKPFVYAHGLRGGTLCYLFAIALLVFLTILPTAFHMKSLRSH